MSRIRRGVFGIAAVVALSSCASAAFAAGPSDAEKRAACRGDVMRYCFSAIPNDDRIERCLRSHKPQLSSTCTALFDRYDAISGRTTDTASPPPVKTEPPAQRETSSTVAPPISEQPAAAASASPAETAQTPPAAAPSSSETPVGARDIFPMEQLMRQMPAAMAKGMRYAPRVMMKAMEQF